MSIAPGIRASLPPATDGQIAAINLESSRRASWSRFRRSPVRPGIAELLLEQEQLTGQFVGDLDALDRCESLAAELLSVDPESSGTALIAAHVASMAHRFAEARSHLAEARSRGAAGADVDRLAMGIDQATGDNLDGTLAARRRIADESRRLEDLVPLAALLADLGEYDEADRFYCEAIEGHRDVSPFPLAWACFQEGRLWTECVPDPRLDLAAAWYHEALRYLPCYVKARVHLAEIHLQHGCPGDAEELLRPAASCDDPEVCWRLADAMEAQARSAEAGEYLRSARSRFEMRLARHPFALADHAAEFYSSSGADPSRALQLARTNLANRPTLRAYELAYRAAIAAGAAVDGLLAEASHRWGATSAFRHSPLSRP